MLYLIDTFKVYFLCRSLVHCYGDIDYKEETKHVFTTAFHKYNERVRPYNNGLNPVEIKANLEFIDIVSIDTKHGQLESIVDLRVVSRFLLLYLLT